MLEVENKIFISMVMPVVLSINALWELRVVILQLRCVSGTPYQPMHFMFNKS